MRPIRALLLSLVVAFVVLFSGLVHRRAPQHIPTGTIREFAADEWLSVARYTNDPKGFPVALRGTTYEGNPATIKPGARVTVWYRGVGERRFVADKVRVLPETARR